MTVVATGIGRGARVAPPAVRGARAERGARSSGSDDVDVPTLPALARSGDLVLPTWSLGSAGGHVPRDREPARDPRLRRDARCPTTSSMRILDAGRLSGSSQNKQQWEFVVVERPARRLAQCVYAPGNVLGAALVVAIVGDARRHRRRPLRAEHDARRVERRRRLVPERHQRRRRAPSASAARR